MSYHVVATYYRDQAYGGPEEGGWWYSTYELADVIGGAQSDVEAWEQATAFNDALEPNEQPRATVVELGRDELKAEYQRYLDYGDGDDLFDEAGNVLPEYKVTRWDVPEYMPETRPYYC